MTILTTAIDRSIDGRTDDFPLGGITNSYILEIFGCHQISHDMTLTISISISRLTSVSTDGDICFIHIAGEEGRTILVARIIINVRRCLTSTTTDDITVRQLVLHASSRI